MHSRKTLSLLSAVLFHAAEASYKYNITAVSAHNGSSTVECWQLDERLDTPDFTFPENAAQVTLGILGPLGSNMSIAVVPPEWDSGRTFAPQPQWVVVTSGYIHVTLPDDNCTSADIFGGEFGLLFAADTTNVSTRGHRTQAPGVTGASFLQIPSKDGMIPWHSILHHGQCRSDEVLGLRATALQGDS